MYMLTDGIAWPVLRFCKRDCLLFLNQLHSLVAHDRLVPIIILKPFLNAVTFAFTVLLIVGV